MYGSNGGKDYVRSQNTNGSDSNGLPDIEVEKGYTYYITLSGSKLFCYCADIALILVSIMLDLQTKLLVKVKCCSN